MTRPSQWLSNPKHYTKTPCGLEENNFSHVEEEKKRKKKKEEEEEKKKKKQNEKNMISVPSYHPVTSRVHNSHNESNESQ
ncbi:hypothetical protein M8J75_009125 [Diaphorina citri]|nr:hypothetical protein M8J75_009125 [Diaphorina citri]